MRYENFHISVFHPPKQQGFESTPRRNLSIVRECKIKFANLLTHPALSPIYQYRWRIMVGEGGFEPPKLSQQIYSLPHLATLELSQLELVDGLEPPAC